MHTPKKKMPIPKNKFETDKVIIIDCGHGGIDPQTNKYVTPGKRSPIWENGQQYFEGAGNRIIGKTMGNGLKHLGWNVLYTVSPDDHSDIPLQIRVDISNEYFMKFPNAFQVSIHSNGVSNPSAHGCEVFTSPGQTKSDPMATIFIQEFLKLFPGISVRSDKRDGDIDKEMNLAINRVKCPSFLIESMFHTNFEECMILLSTEGKNRIANSLINTAERIYAEIILGS